MNEIFTENEIYAKLILQNKKGKKHIGHLLDIIFQKGVAYGQARAQFEYKKSLIRNIEHPSAPKLIQEMKEEIVKLYGEDILLLG